MLHWLSAWAEYGEYLFHVIHRGVSSDICKLPVSVELALAMSHHIQRQRIEIAGKRLADSGHKTFVGVGS